MESPFALEADAKQEAVRQHDLFGTERELVTVSVNAPPFSSYLGRTVELKNMNRFGWGTSKKFRVLAVTTNVRSGKVDLTLWG